MEIPMGNNAEEYPPTVIEILRSLYFSEDPLTSVELKEQLDKRGFSIDDRTVRYHLSNLEKEGLITRFGRKGVMLTVEGSEEARAIFVFDRIGLSSMETEMLIMKSDLDPCSNKGKVIVNITSVPEELKDEALSLLAEVSESNVIVSPLVAVLPQGKRIWNYRVPEGRCAILCLSSANYDVALRRCGVYVETVATGLFRLQGYKGKGFVDVISHSGTTLSPGELLIRGGFTDVMSAVRTGKGCVTAAIKTFPSFMYEKVVEAIKDCKNDNISGLFELGYLMPPKYQMSIKDRTRGYMLIFGGANYLAPLVECGITDALSIASGLYDIEDMRLPKEIQ
ncbi:DUF128 domain-containing protein [Acetomicrobium hydrogeniformans]|uniref:Ribonuclease R winged-helix domain protein n=1 Tax=Acetomicrobium hydrogeniformans ATCC BAA-1850 TaxID=592015 RepID=A0A0T5X8H7_9BACT|nr:NrpR regulatory domain-containing protein [Acetomicrobium hydrogeniformans]KRT34452.1 ribonuclease R winged-helix domain protein [Acetomicrobium hydrogeniformans ATCC BAA-1850]